MLRRLNSSVFRNGPIEFHEGLNIILGDEYGSNSIGKSSLLMIIDYIFGGSGYTKENKDVMKYLGHHKFEFELEFNNQHYYFCRSTQNEKEVDICNEKYIKSKTISLEEYKDFLHKMYIPLYNDLKFRGLVGIFSRIAQKGNYFEEKPLKIVANGKEKDDIQKLIKIFSYHNDIESLRSSVKELESKIKVIKNASKLKYIKKINKKQYEKNLRLINEEYTRVINDTIKTSLDLNEAIFDMNQDIYTELYELKRDKKYLENKLIRLERNIKDNKPNKGSFQQLEYFFNNINIKRLTEVESFHGTINDILQEEFLRNKTELENKIIEKEEKIKNLQSQFSNDHDKVIDIMAPIFETITSIYKKQEENNLYDEFIKIEKEKRIKVEELDTKEKEILIQISKEINDKMLEVNRFIYGDKERAPILSLMSSSYILSVNDNTGTARKFVNLIIFDLSFLMITVLPFVMHDNLLFKNIGNIPMSKIIQLYSLQKKQCFISLDEASKFTEECQRIIEKYRVIELTKENTLFIKDWTAE